MWFTESAWPPIIALVVVAIVWIAIWMQTKRGLLLVLAGLSLAACPVVAIVEQRIVTDRERVEAAVHGITHAFQQKDLDQTLNYISRNAVDVRNLATAAMSIVEVQDDLRVSDVQVRLASQNSRAISRFRANASIALPQFGNLGYQRSFWELSWQKERNEWKVVAVMRMNPVTGEEMAPLAAEE